MFYEIMLIKAVDMTMLATMIGGFVKTDCCEFKMLFVKFCHPAVTNHEALKQYKRPAMQFA